MNVAAAKLPTVGQEFFFGWKRTKNTVTAVYPVEGNSQYLAWVNLRGPRGGEFRAFVRHDGSCRKL